MSRRIVVDARLLHYNRTGIGRYVRHLYGALAGIEAVRRHDLVVGYHRKDRERVLASTVPGAATLWTPAHHRLERWSLAGELLRIRPALVHAPDHVCAQPLGWRTVLTIHDLAFWRLPETHSDESRAYYAGVCRSVQQATRVICVSEATRQDVLAQCGEDVASKLRVVHEAPDPRYTPSPTAQSTSASAVGRPPPARPYVIFTGTIEPRKNVARIITSLAAISAPERPRLLIVGADGNGAEAVRALPATLGVESDVEFLGRLPTDQVVELYRGALALVYPSLMEGFGLPILEAMACGTAVITSNRSSMAEVAGGAALLVDPENEKQLTDAIKRVAGDVALRHSLRETGMRHAASFSWQRAARETLAVFEEALGE